MDALLRLRNVSKSFGRTSAVKPVDLEIHRGDFFAIPGVQLEVMRCGLYPPRRS